MGPHIFDSVLPWAELLFTNIFPAVLTDVYDWLKAWQVLVAAILVLIAGRYWVNAILASLTGSCILISEPIRSLTDVLLRNASREKLTQIAATDETRPAVPDSLSFPQPGDIAARLDSVRELVRSALSAIPVSEATLSGQGAKLYQRMTSFSFEDLCLTTRDNPEHWGLANELQSELSALKAKNLEGVSCQNAWQTLVRVNTLARQLKEKIFSRGVSRPDLEALPAEMLEKPA